MLKLIPGKDIPLPDGLAPGVRGDFDIALEPTVRVRPSVAPKNNANTNLTLRTLRTMGSGSALQTAESGANDNENIEIISM